MGNENPVDFVRAANLEPENEQKILGRNARDLLSWKS
jgi:predicted TIM-barrel fold metal-dependent hydrolase